MKIFSLGLDNSALNKNSALIQRLIFYVKTLDKYVLLVPSSHKQELKISDKLFVFGIKGRNKFWQFINIYAQSKKFLAADKFHVITVQDQYYLALLGLMLSRKFKIGLEIQVHGFEKYWGIRKLIAQYVLKRAQVVRVVSNRLRDRLTQEFHVAADHITVIPIYVNLQVNDEIHAQFQKYPFIFLTVSRLVPIKNIEMQIEAMRRLNNYPMLGARKLWIVGDGPQKVRLQHICKNFKINDSVEFFGWQNNMSKFYKQANAFLLTSNSEGWGMAVVEAANFGLPIIMTDVGLACEIIKNGEGGLIIPVHDVEALENAMLKIMQNESLRFKLSAGAKKAIQALPSQEKNYELILSSWQKASKATV